MTAERVAGWDCRRRENPVSGGYELYINEKMRKRMLNVIKLAVIANQRARWCGNLLLRMEIPTPVCELARNDIFLSLMALSVCFLIF